MEIPEGISRLFERLEQQKKVLTNYSSIHKTLNSKFNNLNTTLDSHLHALDSKLHTLDSSFQDSLSQLQSRHDSLPDTLSTLSSLVLSRKESALCFSSTPLPPESASLLDKLNWVCARMEPGLLIKFLLVKRREASTLRLKMTEALSECVDGERFVIEGVQEFVRMKKEKCVGMTDFRWACSMAVGSMFPPEELKEGRVGMGGMGRVWAKKSVERAREVLREWKEVADNEAAEGLEGSGRNGMWHSEATMFVEVVLGFGLMDMFDKEFYRKLIVEFCGKRVMAKLAVPILGDQIADLIEELVKDGKEVEAIYFAFESGLTERFQPVSLLKTSLRKSKKNCTEILKRGHHSSAAIDEANSMEMIALKAVIKCVEDNQMEEQFPIETLRKRLAVLEKDKADKKGLTVRYSKRTGGARPSGPSSGRPSKMQRRYPIFSRPRREPGPSERTKAALAAAGYTGPYNTYPNTGFAASTYAAPSQGGSHIPASAPVPPASADQVAQHNYGATSESVVSAGPTLSSSYGSEVGYASYDYMATAAPAYQPPSYPH